MKNKMDKKEINSIVEEIWRFYDKDKNGTLEGKELTKFFEDIFKISRDSIFMKDTKKIIEMIDLNSDGRLSKEELKKILSN